MHLRSGKKLLKYKTKFADLGFDIISHIGTFLPFKSFIRLSKACKKISEFDLVYSGRNYSLIKEEMLRLFNTLPGSFKADRILANIIRKAKIPDIQTISGLQLSLRLFERQLFLQALLDVKALSQKCLDRILCMAARESKVQICEKLLREGADVNCGYFTSPSILYNACKRKDFEIIQVLVENGADLEFHASWNRNGLMTAIEFDCSTEIFEYLIASGSNIHRISSSLGSCLHYAAYEGRVDVYFRLLDLGIDSTLVNNGGETAIMFLLKNWREIKECKPICHELNCLNPADLLRCEREIVEYLARD